MSWVKSPTLFQFATPEGVTDVYIGTGDDAGYYKFLLDGAHTIAPKLTSTLTANGAELTLQTGSKVNNRAWYKSADGRYFYYSSQWSKWVYTDGLPAGATPQEESETDSDGNVTWYGDKFNMAKTGTGMPDIGSQAVLYPRGTLRDGGSSVIIKRTFPRVTSSTEFGVYSTEADGGIGVTPTFGTRTYYLNGGLIATVYRSIAKDSTGHFTYGAIHYDADQSKWIIGTYGDSGGWWEGTEPGEDSVTFTFTAPTDDDGNPTVTGTDINCVFLDYFQGPNTQTACVGGIALWL